MDKTIQAQQEYSVEDIVRKSPPLDLSTPIDDTWVKDKTILITGGASGFGEGFFKKWALAGANVIIGDIDVRKGDRLVKDVIRETGNQNLKFIHCDVTDWLSQVEFFQAATKASAHGGIDCVVANAGIVDQKMQYENPQGLDRSNPPAPDLKVTEVNFKGVLYTTHLALFWLPRNPGSTAADPRAIPSRTVRDPHLLFVSSIAGIGPVPTQAEYTASKHALIGLYRSLSGTSFVHGVRTNLLCPYHIATPLLTWESRILVAGGALGKCKDVVEAATRFVANPQIVGRALMISPRMGVQQVSEGRWDYSDKETEEKAAIVELFAHDWEETEASQRRIGKLTCERLPRTADAQQSRH